MRRQHLRLPWVFAALLLLAPAAPAFADDVAENLQRLRAMPPERRAQLVESLESFQKLSADQQAVIRDTDSRIGKLEDEATRARYLSTLRRYHLWLRTLTEDQRKRVDSAATPEERLARVVEIRAQQKEKLRQEESKADWIQVSSLNDVPLFWAAFCLKAWFELNDAERAEVEKIQDRTIQFQRLRDLGMSKGVMKKFRNIRDEFLEEMEKVTKDLGVRAPNVRPAAKAAAKAKRWQPPVQRNPMSRQIEARFLKDHKPAPVDSQHLRWFEQEVPNWLRESLDPLPPDAARRRLTILYRLVFPDSEIPKPVHKAPAAKAGEGTLPADDTRNRSRVKTIDEVPL